jgi:sulfur carrier protein
LHLIECEVFGVLLIINGENREVEDVSSVADLLAQFKLEHKILVVELNRDIVERTDYESSPLREGDRLEIVHFVGGG